MLESVLKDQLNHEDHVPCAVTIDHQPQTTEAAQKAIILVYFWGPGKDEGSFIYEVLLKSQEGVWSITSFTAPLALKPRASGSDPKVGPTSGFLM